MSIPSLSYSLLESFANCPHKAYRKYFARDLPRQPESPEQALGNRIHKEAERFINDLTADSCENKTIEALALPMKQMGAFAETKLGMMADGRGRDFFKEPWARGVVDVTVMQVSTAVIFDWKTGKVREDPKELAFHAMLLKANYPNIKTIKGAYVWLKENALGPMYDLSSTDRVYNATRVAADRLEERLKSQHWPKTPNALCGWCDVLDCEYNRKVR